MSIYDEGPAEANQTRAEWALSALEEFGRHTGQDSYFGDVVGAGDVPDDVMREVAGDLFANLFHLGRLNGVAPETLIRAGLMHFTEEVAEEIEEDPAVAAAAEQVVCEARDLLASVSV
ncbi:hypothetical protein ACFYYS_00340 [Streptomyces sp. NPDC002120]|uniref:hypothetical protein n=1 Tax=Streptomyces sp. NPDC002120 TaxID=3364631 RepID=UPI003696951C